MNEVLSPRMNPAVETSSQDDSMDGIRVSYYQRAMERRLHKAGISLAGMPLIARPASWQKGARIDWVSLVDDEPEPTHTPRLATRRNRLLEWANRLGKHFRHGS